MYATTGLAKASETNRFIINILSLILAMTAFFELIEKNEINREVLWLRLGIRNREVSCMQRLYIEKGIKLGCNWKNYRSVKLTQSKRSRKYISFREVLWLRLGIRNREVSCMQRLYIEKGIKLGCNWKNYRSVKLTQSKRSRKYISFGASFGVSHLYH